jgi:hypothetical protein
MYRGPYQVLLQEGRVLGIGRTTSHGPSLALPPIASHARDGAEDVPVDGEPGENEAGQGD